MIVSVANRHYAKNLISVPTLPAKLSLHRFIQHHIFTVTQIIRTKSHPQIAGSSFFQLSRNNSHYHRTVVFGCLGNAFHQSDISTSIH